MTMWLRLAAILLALVPASACRAQPDPKAPLVLERTIELKGVSGRIDHLAIDTQHRRLFVAELGVGAVEVIDRVRSVFLGSIPGVKEAQGLGYLPGRDELVIASGGDGSVRFYRAGDL